MIPLGILPEYLLAKFPRISVLLWDSYSEIRSSTTQHNTITEWGATHSTWTCMPTLFEVKRILNVTSFYTCCVWLDGFHRQPFVVAPSRFRGACCWSSGLGIVSTRPPAVPKVNDMHCVYHKQGWDRRKQHSKGYITGKFWTLGWH